MEVTRIGSDVRVGHSYQTGIVLSLRLFTLIVPRLLAILYLQDNGRSLLLNLFFHITPRRSLYCL
jgi:hypothetical protein